MRFFFFVFLLTIYKRERESDGFDWRAMITRQAPFSKSFNKKLR